MSDGDGDQSTDGSLGGIIGRALITIVAASASSGGVAASKVVESRLEIVGVGALTFIVVLRLMFPRLGGPQLLLKRQPQEEQPNEYGGGRAHDRGRELRTAIERRFQDGELLHPDSFENAKQQLLQTIINMHALRTSHACRAPITLAVVEDTSGEFIVKKASEDSLGERIRRGMRCFHDGSLKDTVRRHAKYSRDREFRVGGQTYHMVALSDTMEDLEASSDADELIAQATNEYEASYRLVRWMAISSPSNQ